MATTGTTGSTALGGLARRTFDAVLFDMDGTLVDSTPAVTRSWTRWAQEEGVDPALLLGRHGVTARGIVDAVMPERDAAARGAALQRITTIEESDTGGVQALPGAVEALGALAAGGDHGRSAVVTSATRGLALARLSAAGITAPGVVVTASDVSRGKPDPEPFLAAARALRIDPARCLVVEDAPAGLQAGRSAGCATLALATTHVREQLETAPADAIVDDLSSVVFHLDGVVTVVDA